MVDNTTPSSITQPTQNPNSPQNNKFFQFMDAMSLSGAIILLFFSITLSGIFLNQEKVWTTGMTALTTFVSGKQLGKYEGSSK